MRIEFYLKKFGARIPPSITIRGYLHCYLICHAGRFERFEPDVSTGHGEWFASLSLEHMSSGLYWHRGLRNCGWRYQSHILHCSGSNLGGRLFLETSVEFRASQISRSELSTTDWKRERKMNRVFSRDVPVLPNKSLTSSLTDSKESGAESVRSSILESLGVRVICWSSAGLTYGRRRLKRNVMPLWTISENEWMGKLFYGMCDGRSRTVWEGQIGKDRSEKLDKLVVKKGYTGIIR